MKIIIFDNSNSSEAFWKYSPDAVTRHASLENIIGHFVTNLSQIDCMKNSTESLCLLPYNFLTIPIWELVSKLDTPSCDRARNNCYKYLCTAIDQILEHLCVNKTDAGRTISNMLADLFDNEMSSQYSNAKLKYPIYQKNYLIKVDDTKGKVCSNLAFTNIETSVIINQLSIPASSYRELSLVQTPKLKLGTTINPFYIQAEEYIATVDFNAKLPEIWMFYLSLNSISDVVIHSSVFKLLLENDLADCMTIKHLSVAENNTEKTRNLKFLETVNIAEWLKVEVVNKIGIHSIFQSNCNLVFSFTSQIRAATVTKAIDLTKSGICVTCIGPLELSISYSGEESLSVIERCREILLYVE